MNLDNLSSLPKIYDFLRLLANITRSKELAVLEDLNAASEDHDNAYKHVTKEYEAVYEQIRAFLGSEILPYSAYGIRAGDEIIQCISKSLSKSKNVIVNATKEALETGSSSDDEIYDIVMTEMILFHLIDRTDDKLKVLVGVGLGKDTGIIDVMVAIHACPVPIVPYEQIIKLMCDSAHRFQKLHAWPSEWKVKSSGDAEPASLPPLPPSRMRTLVRIEVGKDDHSRAMRAIQGAIEEDVQAGIVQAFSDVTMRIITANQSELVLSACMGKLDSYIKDISSVLGQWKTAALASGLEGVVISDDDDI